MELEMTNEKILSEREKLIMRIEHCRNQEIEMEKCIITEAGNIEGNLYYTKDCLCDIRSWLLEGLSDIYSIEPRVYRKGKDVIVYNLRNYDEDNKYKQTYCTRDYVDPNNHDASIYPDFNYKYGHYSFDIRNKIAPSCLYYDKNGDIIDKYHILSSSELLDLKKHNILQLERFNNNNFYALEKEDITPYYRSYGKYGMNFSIRPNEELSKELKEKIKIIENYKNNTTSILIVFLVLLASSIVMYKM